jgi:hypothetical protein
VIITLYNEIGSQWIKMASHLPGRSENMIKNRFYSHIRRFYLRTQLGPSLDQK